MGNNIVPKKILKAVSPYNHNGFLNFKMAPFEAWSQNGGMTAKGYYPPRFLHGIAFRRELPTIWKDRREARLRFLEPVSLSFDTFPDYVRFEVVPMIWDCWPCYFDKTRDWLKYHKVRTAIFSSRQTAERMREALPDINVIWCAEAVAEAVYDKGILLKDRDIDLLEFGRSNAKIVNAQQLDVIQINNRKILHVCTKQNGKFIYTNEQLYQAMGNSKVTIALPRSITQPKIAGDIETLTQRYWECMFSRMVMVGHAPQELVDFIGYNPVIELRSDISADELICQVLGHIEDYQELVDKNRETAERLGGWKVRMKWLILQLSKYYQI